MAFFLLTWKKKKPKSRKAENVTPVMNVRLVFLLWTDAASSSRAAALNVSHITAPLHHPNSSHPTVQWLPYMLDWRFAVRAAVGMVGCSIKCVLPSSICPSSLKIRMMLATDRLQVAGCRLWRTCRFSLIKPDWTWWSGCLKFVGQIWT